MLRRLHTGQPLVYTSQGKIWKGEIGMFTKPYNQDITRVKMLALKSTTEHTSPENEVAKAETLTKWVTIRWNAYLSNQCHDGWPLQSKVSI